MKIDELLIKARQAAIEMDKQYAITPFKAISALLKAHSLNGGYASEVIQDANKLFCAYFRELSPETRDHIKELKFAKDTVSASVQESGDQWYAHSYAVATVTSYPFSQFFAVVEQGKNSSMKEMINGLLENNKFDLLLHTTPKFNQQVLWHKELFIAMLTVSPAESYDEVFDYMLSHVRAAEKVDYKQTLSTLNLMIQCDCFSPEQLRALSQALNKHFRRFNVENSFLTWALKTRNPICILEALGSTQADKRWDALKHPANYEFFINLIDNNLDTLNRILMLVPDRQMDVLTAKDKEGNCIFHKFASNPQALKALLAKVPADRKLQVANIANNQGHTLLHQVAIHSPDGIAEVLPLWPLAQRLAAVKTVTKDGKNVLQLASKNSKSLSVIVSLLPETDRLDVFKTVTDKGETIAQLAVSHDVSLKDFWSLLPENQRLNALSIANSENDKCVFHELLYKPASLKAINDALPVNQQQSLKQLENLYKKHILFQNIKEMKNHASRYMGFYGGIYWNAHKTEKTFGAIVRLADALESKAIGFFIQSVQKAPSVAEINKFKREFKHLLHSKPELMESHRAVWVVILKNILFGLLTAGIGFIAIAIKAGINAEHAYRQGKDITWNDSLFFAQTQRQKNVSCVDTVVENLVALNPVA